jgi:predicted lipid-binding transport protein (Tim44 family)
MVGQVGGLVAGLGIGALAGATSLTAGFAVLAVVLLLGSLALVRLPSVGDRRTEPATADRAGPDRDADAAEVASHGV